MLARRDPAALADKARSELIIELAPHLEDFLAGQFGISGEVAELQGRHHRLAPLYAVKRKFVQRRAISGVTPQQASAIDGETIASELEKYFGEPLTERVFADRVSSVSMPNRNTRHKSIWPRATPPGRLFPHRTFET